MTWLTDLLFAILDRLFPEPEIERDQWDDGDGWERYEDEGWIEETE